MIISYRCQRRFRACSTLTLLFLILLSVFPQISEAQRTFLRLFDTDGKLIIKGKISAVTDSSITFRKSKRTVLIEDVDLVRTRRSVGNSMLTGALIIGGTGALIGAGASELQNNSNLLHFSMEDGAAVGVLLGSTFGAMVGLVNGVIKPRKVFKIQGNRILWIPVKERLQKYL